MGTFLINKNDTYPLLNVQIKDKDGNAFPLPLGDDLESKLFKMIGQSTIVSDNEYDPTKVDHTKYNMRIKLDKGDSKTVDITGNAGINAIEKLHITHDISNAVTGNTTSAGNSRLLTNNIKNKFNSHIASSTFHILPDSGNTITSLNATDLATQEILLAEIRSKYGNHLNNPGSHYIDDIFNKLVITSDPVGQETSDALAEELRDKFNSHRVATNPSFSQYKLSEIIDNINASIGSSVASSIESSPFEIPAGTVAINLDGKYIAINGRLGTVIFWFDIDNTGTVAPPNNGNREVEVSTIVTGDTPTQIATKLSVVINGEVEFFSDSINTIINVTDSITAEKRTGFSGTNEFVFTTLLKIQSEKFGRESELILQNGINEVSNSALEGLFGILPGSDLIGIQVTKDSSENPTDLIISTEMEPAKYEDALAADTSQLGPNAFNIKLEIDGLEKIIDVTGDGGNSPSYDLDNIVKRINSTYKAQVAVNCNGRIGLYSQKIDTDSKIIISKPAENDVTWALFGVPQTFYDPTGHTINAVQSGKITYKWKASDTDTEGSFEGIFEISGDFGDGDTRDVLIPLSEEEKLEIKVLDN